MSALQNIEKILSEYEAAKVALNNALKENGKKCIEEVFTKIFKEHEGLNYVMIIGETPSFNDGEPCTHSQETYVGDIGWGEYFDYENFDDCYYEEFEHSEVEDGIKTNINSKCTTLKEAKAKISCFDEIIERVYDTNFIIKVTRSTDGSAEVDVDEYDCGY